MTPQDRANQFIARIKSGVRRNIDGSVGKRPEMNYSTARATGRKPRRSGSGVILRSAMGGYRMETNLTPDEVREEIQLSQYLTPEQRATNRWHRYVRRNQALERQRAFTGDYPPPE